jgi:hypothetical protein
MRKTSANTRNLQPATCNLQPYSPTLNDRVKYPRGTRVSEQLKANSEQRFHSEFLAYFHVDFLYFLTFSRISPVVAASHNQGNYSQLSVFVFFSLTAVKEHTPSVCIYKYVKRHFFWNLQELSNGGIRAAEKQTFWRLCDGTTKGRFGIIYPFCGGKPNITFIGGKLYQLLGNVQ